jgi:hypothetical protein
MSGEERQSGRRNRVKPEETERVVPSPGDVLKAISGTENDFTNFVQGVAPLAHENPHSGRGVVEGKQGKVPAIRPKVDEEGN